VGDALTISTEVCSEQLDSDPWGGILCRPTNGLEFEAGAAQVGSEGTTLRMLTPGRSYFIVLGGMDEVPNSNLRVLKTSRMLFWRFRASALRRTVARHHWRYCQVMMDTRWHAADSSGSIAGGEHAEEPSLGMLRLSTFQGHGL